MQSATCFTLRKDQGMHTNVGAVINPPQSSRCANLQGHALALDLGDPRLHALLGHVRLVVLVARQACARNRTTSVWRGSPRQSLRAMQARLRRTNELVALNGLGLHVVVALGRPGADDLGALVGEAGLQLVHGVAEVVAVAALVAQAEDGHLLALEVEAGQVAVDEPARERVRMSDRPTNGAGKLRQQGVARTRPTRCPSARSPRRCARWARQR